MMGAADLHITRHAITRYRERVADIPEREICRCLTSHTVLLAALIGAPVVRLPTGQRIILRGSAIVTVLPCDTTLACLDRRIDRSAFS